MTKQAKPGAVRHTKKKKRPKIGCLLLLILLLVAGLLAYQRLPSWLSPIKYQEIIWEQAAANNIDPLLVCAVIKSESNFEQAAASHAGAIGLMQLMPDTAEWIAKKEKIEYNVDKLVEPEYNIMLGCHYLNFLLNYWENDLPKAIASYNAGQTNVIGWLKAGVWDGTSKDLEAIPFAETRKYTGKVLKNYARYIQVYAELEQYQYELE